MRCARGGGDADGGAGAGSASGAGRAGGMTSRRALFVALGLVLLTTLLIEQPLPLWVMARGGAETKQCAEATAATPPTAAAAEEETAAWRAEDDAQARKGMHDTRKTARLHAVEAAVQGGSEPADVVVAATTSIAARGGGVKVFEGEPVAGENHIFFVETSCALSGKPDPVPYDSESGLRLSPRGACALEAAAAAHPTHHVYLVHTCSVRRRALARGAAPPYALAALSAPNVRLWVVRYARLYVGTPLASWLASGALRRSLWPVVHASDVVRFLLLWKYGGTYLDLDVLMLRSLGEEKNFGCAESTIDVSVGAFNFAMDKPGRRVANACVAELLNYRPDLWSYNGPGAITRALKTVCNVEEVSQMTEKKCEGFRLLPTSTFYAIPWQNWNLFFAEENAEETMKKIGNNLAVHVWNALSHNTSVDISSKQPYAQIAHRVCPNVVAAMGDRM